MNSNKKRNASFSPLLKMKKNKVVQSSIEPVNFYHDESRFSEEETNMLMQFMFSNHEDVKEYLQTKENEFSTLLYTPFPSSKLPQSYVNTKNRLDQLENVKSEINQSFDEVEAECDRIIRFCKQQSELKKR